MMSHWIPLLSLVASTAIATAPASVDTLVARSLADSLRGYPAGLEQVPAADLIAALSWKPSAPARNAAFTDVVRFWAYQELGRRMSPRTPTGGGDLSPDGISWVNMPVSVNGAETPSLQLDSASIDRLVRLTSDPQLTPLQQMRVARLLVQSPGIESLLTHTVPVAVEAVIASLPSQPSNPRMAQAEDRVWADFVRVRPSLKPGDDHFLFHVPRSGIDWIAEHARAFFEKELQAGHALLPEDERLFGNPGDANVAELKSKLAVKFAAHPDPKVALSGMKLLFNYPNGSLYTFGGDGQKALDWLDRMYRSGDRDARSIALARIVEIPWDHSPATAKPHPDWKVWAPRLREGFASMRLSEQREVLNLDVRWVDEQDFVAALNDWLEGLLQSNDPETLELGLVQTFHFNGGQSVFDERFAPRFKAVLKRIRENDLIQPAWQAATLAALRPFHYDLDYSQEQTADQAAIHARLAQLPPPPDGPPCGNGVVSDFYWQKEQAAQDEAVREKILGLPPAKAVRDAPRIAALLKKARQELKL